MLMLQGHTAEVMAVAFSPDGSRLASAGWDGAIRVWPRDGGPPLILRTANDHAQCVAFSPDGTHLAAGFRNSRPALKGLDFGHFAYFPLTQRPDGKEIGIRHIDTWFPGDVEFGTDSAAFCPTRPWLVMISGEVPETCVPGLGLFSVIDRKNVGSFRSAGMTLRRGAFSPDGTEVAAIGRWPGEGVAVWSIDRVNKRRRTIFSEPHTHRVPEETAVAVVYTPDSCIVAVAFKSGLVLWWEPGNDAVRMHTGHTSGTLRCMAFSPDGRWFATAGLDGLVKLWDTATRRLQSRFDWKAGDIHTLAFAPDGLTIAAGGHGCVLIWDV